MNTGDKVIVTTSHRGIFFGTLAERHSDKHVTLEGCRNCYYYPRGTNGFLGLATVGPLDGAKVGPAAPSFEIVDVTGIARCTDAAVERWESAQWS